MGEHRARLDKGRSILLLRPFRLQRMELSELRDRGAQRSRQVGLRASNIPDHDTNRDRHSFETTVFMI